MVISPRVPGLKRSSTWLASRARPQNIWDRRQTWHSRC